MSGSIDQLKACLLATDDASNDHDYICECRPVDVRAALAEVERLNEQLKLTNAIVDSVNREADEEVARLERQIAEMEG